MYGMYIYLYVCVHTYRKFCAEGMKAIQSHRNMVEHEAALLVAVSTSY